MNNDTNNKVNNINKNAKEINVKIYDMDENVRRNTTLIEKLEKNAGIL